MRRRLRILIVLASTFAMVLMLNVGTAFANDKGHATNWTCTLTVEDLCVAPVPGGEATMHALGPVFNSPAFTEGQGFFFGVPNNPLCLLHEGGDPNPT